MKPARIVFVFAILLGCAEPPLDEEPPLEAGAYLATGEAMLSTGSSPQLRTEEIGIFVDESGTPTHVYDRRWGELHEVRFAEGEQLSDDACPDGRCKWLVERDTGCVRIEYDEFFRTGRYDDTGDQWTGTMTVCPGDEPYERTLVANAERGTPWLMPGDSLILEANYPLDPDDDVFEVVVDGARSEPSPTVVDDDAHWRLAVPPALDSLEVRALGARGLAPSTLPEPVPTTAVIDDWTLATEPPPGSYAGLVTSYEDGALVGETPGHTFYTVHALFALGPVEGSVLNAELSIASGGFGGNYTHVYTARADGSLGPIVNRVGESVPIAGGSGDLWLVVSHDPLGHPYADQVGIRFGGLTVE
jgi:hypothetical protein